MTRNRSYRKKKPFSVPTISLSELTVIKPLTKNQERLFDAYRDGKSIIAHGYPGVGKSLLLFYKALEEVLDTNSPYNKVIIVRSTVATRDIGFLKGSVQDKIEQYELPYKQMMRTLFDLSSDEQYEMFYGNLKAQNIFEFVPTNFIRGTTFEDCVMIVDEFSNLTFHELDSIITRVGQNCKIHFCGDIEQSDFVKASEKKGATCFLNILSEMESFERIDFDVDDIVRSTLVKEYIVAKHKLGLFSDQS
jgi:predicted ribonuclease YlaK